MSAPLRLPAATALLLRPRRDAIDALLAVGWRPWAIPFDLDAERRRALNLDLADPERLPVLRAVADGRRRRGAEAEHLRELGQPAELGEVPGVEPDRGAEGPPRRVGP